MKIIEKLTAFLAVILGFFIVSRKGQAKKEVIKKVKETINSSDYIVKEMSKQYLERKKGFSN